MDAGGIRNVLRPGLSTAGRAGSTGAVQRVGTLARPQRAIAYAHGQACVEVALDLLSLARRQHPRICSANLIFKE